MYATAAVKSETKMADDVIFSEPEVGHGLAYPRVPLHASSMLCNLASEYDINCR